MITQPAELATRLSSTAIDNMDCRFNSAPETSELVSSLYYSWQQCNLSVAAHISHWALSSLSVLQKVDVDARRPVYPVKLPCQAILLDKSRPTEPPLPVTSV